MVFKNISLSIKEIIEEMKQLKKEKEMSEITLASTLSIRIWYQGGCWHATTHKLLKKEDWKVSGSTPSEALVEFAKAIRRNGSYKAFELGRRVK